MFIMTRRRHLRQLEKMTMEMVDVTVQATEAALTFGKIVQLQNDIEKMEKWGKLYETPLFKDPIKELRKTLKGFEKSLSNCSDCDVKDCKKRKAPKKQSK